ncbi:response regulator [Desulforhopalus sp. 52FAK]
MPYTIALVEDDALLRANYQKALEREGYLVQAYSCRPDASLAFQTNLPDLAILDIMLGDEHEGGFHLCTELRQLSPIIPIIFLTARDSDIDRVSGLRLGAWDYMTKGTTTLDFLPVRISALFTIVETLGQTGKTKGDNPDISHTIGMLQIYPDQKRVFWREQAIDLTLTEFWLLYSLCKHPGHLKSHDQLMEAASIVVTGNAISAHIRRIREKFQTNDPDFNGIRTEYGMGYRWMVE